MCPVPACHPVRPVCWATSTCTAPTSSSAVRPGRDSTSPVGDRKWWETHTLGLRTHLGTILYCRYSVDHCTDNPSEDMRGGNERILSSFGWKWEEGNRLCPRNLTILKIKLQRKRMTKASIFPRTECYVCIEKWANCEQKIRNFLTKNLQNLVNLIFGKSIVCNSINLQITISAKMIF